MTTYRVPTILLQKAADMAEPGDVVEVEAGEYKKPLVWQCSGTKDRPITFRAVGRVALGGHVRPESWPGDNAIGGANDNPYIVFNGFRFDAIDSLFQLRMSRGCEVVSCVFENARNGINARGDGVKILNSTFYNHAHHAYVVYGSASPEVIGNTVLRANFQGVADPAGSAVSKFGYTTGLKVERNRISGGVGPGIWLDFENRSYEVRQNMVDIQRGRTASWQGPGIVTEINAGPGLITGNAIRGNSGPGIAILESAEVTVEKNVIDGGYAGIELRNLARGPGIHRLLLRENTIRNLVAVPDAREAAIKYASAEREAEGVVSYGNIFAVGQDRPLYDWLGVKAYTVQQAQDLLGFER